MKAHQRQHQEKKLIEDAGNFFADGWICLLLVRVEKRCDNVAAQIGAKVCLNLVLQIIDLALVEEVKRAVVLVHPRELRGNQNLLRRGFNRAWRDDFLSRFEASSDERSSGFDADLDVLVLERGEFMLPEQCQEIVSVGKCDSSSLNQLEKNRELALFEYLREGQLPNPISVEEPRKTVRCATGLLDNQVTEPAKIAI